MAGLKEGSGISIKEQEDMLNLIGKTLKRKVECFAVGGTAMMFLGLKEITKDIDLLFKTKKDYENFKDILLKLGARETEATIINPEKVSCILSLGSARFDLFLEHLIHFKLTETIISRTKEIHEFGNLVIKAVSPEDIILFKSMADREADRVDVAEIIKKAVVSWGIILEEAEEQTKGSKFFFSAFLYNFLVGVKEDLKADIPKDFMKTLKEASEKAILKAEKMLNERKLSYGHKFNEL